MVGYTATMETAVFGGGCFWCTEAVYKMLKGVSAVAPGYTGGTVDHPTYEQVCTGTTGHAEVIKIDYDPKEVTYRDLLTIFFASHDPTQLNRQGADVGTQYRSAVFYTTEEQKTEAEKFVAELNDAPGGKAVTEVVPLGTFWPAESYHKDYYERNQDAAYCQIVINPKLEKVQERYEALLKEAYRSKKPANQ